MKKMLFAVLLVLPFSAQAELLKCKLVYNLKGWSFLYRTYSGHGTVTCANGQLANVKVKSRGGGISFGKSEIDHGEGTITDLKDISEIYGAYVYVGGHIGATRSVEGSVMTKGEVSLALSGDGRGIDIGFSFGEFRIDPM